MFGWRRRSGRRCSGEGGLQVGGVGCLLGTVDCHVGVGWTCRGMTDLLNDGRHTPRFYILCYS